jgi:site-specific DNA recombinase
MNITIDEYGYLKYARRSLDELGRQVLSVSSQFEEIDKRFPNIKIIDKLEESASAFKPNNRPVFTSMLERIMAGEAQGIACWHPDRLSRNPLDAAQIIYLLDQGIIKDLKFVTYNFENTPEGKMLLNFMLGQSKYHSDKLSRDIKRGNLAKLKLGQLPGKAPQGYKNIHLKNGTKTTIPDEPRFSLLKQAWKLHLTGAYTVPMILHKLNDEWGYKTNQGKPLTRSALYNIFTNEFYSGWINRKEGRFKGSHQKMIDEEEFERTQLILGRPGKPKPRKNILAFSGMIRCEDCHNLISGDVKRHCYCYDCSSKFTITKKRHHCPGCGKSAYAVGMKLLTYTYYGCPHNRVGVECHQPAIPEKELENQIIEYLKTIYIPPAFTSWIIKWLKHQHHQEVDDRNKQLQSMQKAYKATQTKLDNLVDMRLNDLIDDEQYKTRKSSLNKDKSRLKDKLDSFDDRANQWIELTEQTLQFATLAPTKFKRGSLEDKRQILAFITSKLTLSDKKLIFEPRKPFRLVQAQISNTPVIQAKTETVKLPELPIQNVDLQPALKILCWEEDSNLRRLAPTVLQTVPIVHSGIPANNNQLYLRKARKLSIYQLY